MKLLTALWQKLRKSPPIKTPAHIIIRCRCGLTVLDLEYHEILIEDMKWSCRCGSGFGLDLKI